MIFFSSDRRYGIQLQIDDLDYVDDAVLLSNRFDGISRKLETLEYNSKKISLKINTGKTKIMHIGTKNTQPLSFHGTTIVDVDEFC